MKYKVKVTTPGYVLKDGALRFLPPGGILTEGEELIPLHTQDSIPSRLGRFELENGVDVYVNKADVEPIDEEE